MWTTTDALEQFNSSYQINDSVWYQQDDGTMLAAQLRSKAWALGDGTPVVEILGRPGGVHIERIYVRDDGSSIADKASVLQGGITQAELLAHFN